MSFDVLKKKIQERKKRNGDMDDKPRAYEDEKILGLIEELEKEDVNLYALGVKNGRESANEINRIRNEINWSGRSEKEIRDLIREKKHLGMIAERLGNEKEFTAKEVADALVNFGEWVLSSEKKKVHHCPDCKKDFKNEQEYFDHTDEVSSEKKEWRNKDCVHYDENTSCPKCRNSSTPKEKSFLDGDWNDFMEATEKVHSFFKLLEEQKKDSQTKVKPKLGIDVDIPVECQSCGSFVNAIKEVSSAPKEKLLIECPKCEFEYINGLPDGGAVLRCHQGHEFEHHPKKDVSREEKPYITSEELDEIATKLRDRFGEIITDSGLRVYISRKETSIFTLSEMADLIEKLENHFSEWVLDGEEWSTVHENGVVTYDWSRLFREKPDLVEKIRKEK